MAVAMLLAMNLFVFAQSRQICGRVFLDDGETSETEYSCL